MLIELLIEYDEILYGSKDAKLNTELQDSYEEEYT